MTWLILSIILSSFLFAGFKWFDLKNVNLLVAISGNYLACIITGLVIHGFSNTPGLKVPQAGQEQIIFTCLGLGVLFFFTFYAMAYVSAKIGVGIASASSKMSLVIPVLAGVLFFGGEFGPSKIIAFILALIAVLLMSRQAGTSQRNKQLLLPFLVFLGSGIIDTALGMVEAMDLARHLDPEKQVIYIFSGAFLSAFVFIWLTQKHLLSDFRSLAFGMALGVPNYFSILVIVKAMASKVFLFHEFFMINNTGIMVLSFLLGLVLFGEKISPAKGIGIVLAITSIYLVLYC
jgi:drug/metabolite transporter (DMT)-like permease